MKISDLDNRDSAVFRSTDSTDMRNCWVMSNALAFKPYLVFSLAELKLWVFRVHKTLSTIGKTVIISNYENGVVFSSPFAFCLMQVVITSEIFLQSVRQQKSFQTKTWKSRIPKPNRTTTTATSCYQSNFAINIFLCYLVYSANVLSNTYLICLKVTCLASKWLWSCTPNILISERLSCSIPCKK